MNKFEKCQVIMLPAKEATKIGVCIKDMADRKHGYLEYFSSPMFMSTEYWDPQYLYILSDNEIKAGDWAYHAERGIIFHVKKILENHFIPVNFEELRLTPTKSKCLKIIATNNPELNLPGIPATFIHSYCASSGSITEVMVQYEPDEIATKLSWADNKSKSFEMYIKENWIYKPKVLEGTILTKSIKQTFTRAEVEALLLKYDAELHGGLTNTTSLNAWINKNL